MSNARMQWVRRQSPVPALLVVAALWAAVALPHEWGERGDVLIAEAARPGSAPARMAAVHRPGQPHAVSAGLRLDVLQAQVDALRPRVLQVGRHGAPTSSRTALTREQEAALRADFVRIEAELASLRRELAAKRQETIVFGSEEDRRVRDLHKQLDSVFGRLWRPGPGHRAQPIPRLRP